MVPSARPPPLRPLAGILVAALASGCLGHVYELPRSELEHLVRTPPAERGRAVYAVQQFDTVGEPEPAPAWPPPPGEPPPGYGADLHGYWSPSLYLDYGPPSTPPCCYHAATAVGGGASGGGSPHPGSGGSSPGDASISDLGPVLVAAIAIGVSVGVVLAVSEGARYEGIVAVHPHHPVHLLLHGEQRLVGLDELSQDDLRGDVKALLVDHEGAGLWLRDRAPLDRKGFSFQFGAGDDSLALPGWRIQDGLGWRFALGYFPTKAFGLLGESRLQLGGDGASSFYDVRAGLEGQWYPIALWRLHLGAFAGGGQAWFASAGGGLPAIEGARPYVDFGGLAEIDLTTHLGLTFRWIEDWLPTAGPDTRPLGASWSVGLAVY